MGLVETMPTQSHPLVLLVIPRYLKYQTYTFIHRRLTITVVAVRVLSHVTVSL
jgi:hypothetical protein